jgi:hypothetical protein
MSVKTFFTTIKHWGGIVIADVLNGLNKATMAVDAEAPKIETLLEDGASVTTIIPGPIGVETTAALNLGVELVGALNKTLDFTDEAFQTMVAQAKTSLNPGYSLVVIATELEAEAKAWFAALEVEIAASKAAATAITGNHGAPAAQKPPTA